MFLCSIELMSPAVVWLTHISLQEVAVTKLWETWEEEVGAEGC